MFTLPSSRDVVGGILLFAASADAFMPIGGMLPSIRTSSASVSVRATTLGPVMQMTKQRKQELLKNKDLPDLFKGNDEWRAKMMAKDEQFFYKSAQGQSPKYLWIGCSDARVPANEIVGCGPGELFVHRNIANLVVNNDNSLQSVFQYAVEYLQVQHIIVCAHYDCSGVTASMEKLDLTSPLDEWVRNIRDVYRLHKDELDSIVDFEQRKNRLVELNAQEQALNVYKTAVVQRRRVYTSMKEGNANPKVHAMVFNPKTGYIKRLNTFNAGEEIAVLGKYYDLYNVESAKQLWGDLDEYPKRTNAPTRQAAPVLSKGADAGALPGAPTEEEEAELAAAAAAVKTEE